MKDRNLFTQITLRIPIDLHQALILTALERTTHTSLNTEIITRLRSTFDPGFVSLANAHADHPSLSEDIRAIRVLLEQNLAGGRQ